MKHVSKITAVLAFSLLTVACNNTKNINQIKQGSEKVVINSDYEFKVADLQTIYNKLYSSGSAGTLEAISAVVVEMAKLETTKRASELETRVNDKLLEKAKNTSYLIDGVFHEELLVDALRGENYNISCTSGYSNDKKVLKCDYTDYKERKLKVDVLKEMLNEEYILAEKSNLIRDKKIREIEYITISYTETTKVKALELVEAFANRIRTEPNADFNLLAKDWNDYKKSLIDVEVAKIGTDKDKNHSIESKYTGSNAYPVARGVDLAYKAIDEAEYIKKDAYSFTSTVANFDTETNDLIKNADKLVEIKKDNLAVKYVPSHYAMDNIYINNKDANEYVIIRVLDIIDKDSPDASRLKAAKVLAKTSSNVKGAIPFYMEKYKLSIHEKDLADYIKQTYEYSK